MNLTLAFEILFVATVEQTEDGRFRLTYPCMRMGIAVKESFFTPLCLALKLEAGKSVYDYPVDFFGFEHSSTFPTVSIRSLFLLPNLTTFSAQKAWALFALNWIIHYKWTNHADKVFIYWSRFNDVILVKLVCYHDLPLLDWFQVVSYGFSGKLYVRFEQFFLFFWILNGFHYWLGFINLPSKLYRRVFVCHSYEISTASL